MLFSTGRTTTVVTSLPFQLSCSWEASSRSNTHDIRSISSNPLAHYLAQNSPSLVLIPNQMNPAHTLLSYFFEIHFSSIFLSTPTSLKWRFPSDIRTKIFAWICLTSPFLLYKYLLNRFDLIVLVITDSLSSLMQLKNVHNLPFNLK
jgi:hypothetical protein